ncbi:MAG: hypothetical protein JWO38_7960 [Gemmataceae bacterium]|nr:hypothetical protein [Gemmataceae bacterium]
MSALPPPADGPSQTESDLATLLFRWAWVMTPLSWGVWETVRTSLALFR